MGLHQACQYCWVFHLTTSVVKIILRRWQVNEIWVWSIGGMMWTGEDRSTGRKTCLVPVCVPQKPAWDSSRFEPEPWLWEAVAINTLSHGAFAKLRKATLSFVVSVRPRGTTRFPLDGFWWKLIFELFFFPKICRENSSFIKNPTIITGTLHEDVFTFMTISR